MVMHISSHLHYTSVHLFSNTKVEVVARAAHTHSQVLKQLLKQTSIQLNSVHVMME